MTKGDFFIAAFFAICCSLTPLTAPAQKVDCSKAASTAEQDQCADQVLTMAETDLNAALSEALQSYTPRADEQKENAALPRYDRDHEALYERRMRSDLQESQKIWLQYRAAACAAVSDKYDGGTIRPAATSLCKADMTQQRTKFLRDNFGKDSH
jgi:uncharacterized protein YecT (DUF1311 family)